LFAFFSLLGVSIWLYNVYKNRNQNITVIPQSPAERRHDQLFDYKTPDNLEPHNNLQHDGSLDFANLSYA
jgi:hypothetical protein